MLFYCMHFVSSFVDTNHWDNNSKKSFFNNSILVLKISEEILIIIISACDDPFLYDCKIIVRSFVNKNH
jgi:hypothetical protein